MDRRIGMIWDGMVWETDFPAVSCDETIISRSRKETYYNRQSTEKSIPIPLPAFRDLP